MQSRSRHTLFTALAVNVALPLVLFYVLRGAGMVQWQALLLSSAPPALHALGEAVIRRRVDPFDMFVLVLLLVSAGTSVISGSPRVLLLKDAALPAALGLWILSTLTMARPFAFQFGARLRGPEAAAVAERAWRESAEFRGALRGLTALWGGMELLDAALSTVNALVLPVDVVPLVGRIASLGLIGLSAVISIHRSRSFRARHGIPLFGARPERGAGQPHMRLRRAGATSHGRPAPAERP
ncbi:VC0807 family protein [Streptoverticillium reticulum]|uniref:VC0807 family protein n=1 Tax=Streptoverticillium reticulum TaxID=1433415 RepID=UPI0039BF7A81